MNRIFLVLIILFTSFACEKKKDDTKEKIILGAIVYRLTSGVVSGAYDCLDVEASRSFSGFVTAIEAAPNPCTNCHNSDTRTSGLDLTNHSQASSKVNFRNPENSLLFLKVTTGTMKFYSNEKTNQAIYCWILNGNRN
ncbi:MAG: c-type cytochrome domain-containing protein [Leptospiraceae bacterium]|nr:c-type cytochrome domain-containing protein [Leptospiraceae bacterium]